MELRIESIISLLLASLLGAMIGFEREIHGRPAGFRTHLLVSLGSCLFVVASIHFYQLYGNMSGLGPPGVDPGRVAAQVVTGIGFLGAGAIIRERASIRGLTTAACLWVAAAIGLACGIGLYTIASFVTLVALVSLLFLKKVENRLTKDKYGSIKVWSEDSGEQTQKIEKVLSEYGLEVMNVVAEKDIRNRELYMSFEVKLGTADTGYKLLDNVIAIPGVKKARVQ